MTVTPEKEKKKKRKNNCAIKGGFMICIKIYCLF